ncbi:MAG: hypothetical protein ACFE7E_02460 [Candidatus Hodarchaeota archaeon]
MEGNVSNLIERYMFLITSDNKMVGQIVDISPETGMFSATVTIDPVSRDNLPLNIIRETIKDKAILNMDENEFKAYRERIVDEVEEWIGKALEYMGLGDYRYKYSYLPVYDGILMFLKDHSITWVPESHILGALSKAGIKSKLIHNASLLMSFLLPGGSIAGVAYNFFKDRVWKTPPTDVKHHLIPLLDRVEFGTTDISLGRIRGFIGRIKSGLGRVKEGLGRVKHAIKRDKDVAEDIEVELAEHARTEEDEGIFHFVRFVDKIEAAKEAEEQEKAEREGEIHIRENKIRGFSQWLNLKFRLSPVYRCPSRENLLKFVRKLKEANIEVLDLNEMEAEEDSEI